MTQWLVNFAVMTALQTPFLLALGLHYDVLRRHNFLLGSAYALALCLVVGLLQPAGVFMAVAAAFLAVLAVLLLSEFLVFGPLERFGRTADEILIATLGANILLEQVLSVAFGDRIRFPSVSAEPAVQWFLGLPPAASAIPIGLAILFACAVLFHRTEAGARLVALGENALLFRALGFSPTAWRVIALAIVALVLACSAIGAANVTGAYPTAGFGLVILGFLTRLLGGPVHRPRFLLTAVSVIAFDQLVSAVLPGQWRTLVLFSALLLLIIRRSLVARSTD